MTTEAEFDERVLKALPGNPIAAKDLADRLTIAWNGPEIVELRKSLLRLQEQGKADLTYGRGWFGTDAAAKQVTGLTPYDRGERLEPKPWVRERKHVVYPDEEYGKVDFEDDESTTVCTVWIEKQGIGYVVHLQNPMSIPMTWQVHNG